MAFCTNQVTCNYIPTARNSLYMLPDWVGELLNGNCRLLTLGKERGGYKLELYAADESIPDDHLEMGTGNPIQPLMFVPTDHYLTLFTGDRSDGRAYKIHTLYALSLTEVGRHLQISKEQLMGHTLQQIEDRWTQHTRRLVEATPERDGGSGGGAESEGAPKPVFKHTF